MFPSFLIIHHTASPRDKTTLQNVNAWHYVRWPKFKSSLGFYIGYHFLITANGKISQIRRENETGAHCLANNMNSKSIGICLTGNFSIETPTTKQGDSLAILLDNLKKKYDIPNKNILGHCQIANAKTQCPGKNLLSWLEKYKKT